MTSTRKSLFSACVDLCLLRVRQQRLWISLSVCLAAALILPVTACVRKTRSQQATEMLVETLRARRTIEPRVSGGFVAASYEPNHADPLEGLDQTGIERANEILTKEIVDADDLEAKTALGRLWLISGKARESDTLEWLRDLASRDNSSAAAHNDLGVCLLESGRLEEALDEFNRTLELSPAMPEPLFNRAVCYERMLLYEPAILDLDQLVKVESDRGWRNEAALYKSRLANPPAKRTGEDILSEFYSAAEKGSRDVARRIASERFQAIRQNAILELVPKYINACDLEKGSISEESEQVLSRLKRTGELLSEVIGDQQIADISSFLETMSGPDLSNQLLLMREYVAAVEVFRAGERDRALALVKDLEPRLSAAGNLPFWAGCSSILGGSYFDVGKFSDAIAVQTRAFIVAKERRWNYLAGTLLCQIGVSNARLGRDSLALEQLAEALRFCRSAPELEAKIYQYQSIPYSHLGDLDKMLEKQRESTRLYIANPGMMFDDRNMAFNLYQMSSISLLRNRHDLAVLYANSAIKYAGEKSILYTASAWAVNALSYAQLGRPEAAHDALYRAFEWLERASSEPEAKRVPVEALVLSSAGRTALLGGDVELALKWYSNAEAQARFDKANTLPLIGALNGRTTSYLHARDLNHAAVTGHEAMKLVDDYRGNLKLGNERATFLGTSQETFDNAVGIYFLLNRLTEAFSTQERSRARALLEELHLANSKKPADFQPLELNQIQSALPPGLVLLSYSVTTDRTLIFITSRSEMHCVESPATIQRLDGLVQEYVSLLREKAPLSRIDSLAQSLYELLIQPAESRIPRGSSLCIIPDKALHFLPFAALRNRSGEYLIQSHALTYAPSASVLVNCLSQQKKRASAAPEQALVVGNPRIDSRRFPGLPPLPDAAGEAVAVSNEFRNSIRLLGENATEKHVCDAMQRSDVIHVASHCLVNEQSPWLAALLLSARETARDQEPISVLVENFSEGIIKDDDDGVLYLDEVYSLKLPRTRLVVLSACQTGLGKFYRGEGMVSLVRPFLATGVPTVVSSLWPVNSTATKSLMTSFHKERNAAGRDNAAGLKAAQMNMLGSGIYSHPYYWAPFIVIGN